ncbi:uncharacterized protein LOC116347514 [Contarinia nasturtii]|uniref:uncharacterized protein LOC116347514 n=1 Tax=Contarinia nasturtii TaxID=265458 RepID=UPI0012D47AE9|nr:uncharacterized protein LOC116347514 [Contarinia nasturtii]
MIKFYQSIPKYDDVRHLPEYDFSQRVEMLKKVHGDLSETMLRPTCKRPVSSASRCSKRKNSAKKKKSQKANSLCNSFSKASLVETNENVDDERLHSASSFVMPSPPPPIVLPPPSPIKRLQALREKLLTCVDDWECEPKIPTPIIVSPMCSPSFHLHKLHHHYHHDHDPYPCDNLHNTIYFLNDHDDGPVTRNSNCFHSPPTPASASCPIEFNSDFKRNLNCNEKSTPTKEKVRRAKSCPKDLFSVTSSRCSDSKKCIQNGSIEIDNSAKPQEFEPSFCNESVSPTTISRQQNAYPKTTTKIKVKPKSKTPNSMDEFISSKLVRSNLAAILRHRNSRKKINDLAEEKLKEHMDVSKFIPNCHKWDVRKSDAWKTFTSEDTSAEKRMREEARQEEQKLRKHTHTMAMNIMRARVKSAQLLLEGRSLSAKY